jgi:hypothetical protein
MEFSNQIRTKTIKRFFNTGGIIIVLTGLLFLLLKQDLAVLITAGVFIVYVGISLFPNLNYVYFSTEGEKVVIRYYPIITFLKKDYESIEFAKSALFNFKIGSAMGFSDLDIAIRTKRGLAGFPAISLAALSKAEIEQIRQALLEIMKNNN